MAKHTLLKMTQLILSSMDSDEVETITETVESDQVVKVIGRVFEELLDRREWEFTKHRPRQLDDDVTNPVTVLDIPDDVMHVEEVRYKDFDNSDFVLLEYVSPAEFVQRTKNRDTTQSNIVSVTISDGVTTGVYNDRVPTFYTSFDEETLAFDAYDSANEALLQGSNSAILAQIRPAFTESDSFVAGFPQRMFSLYLHEAMSLAWIELKQEAHPKAEQIASREYKKLKQLERRVTKDVEMVDYSRRRVTGSHSNLLCNNRR